MAGETSAGVAQGAAAGSSFGPWGTVIGAVLGYFAGKSAEKAALKLTPQQKQLFNIIISNSKTASEAGQMILNLARDPMVSSVNYLNSAAGGDRETLLRLSNPDLANISEGARQSIQTMAQLTPRSGASAEFLSRIPFNVATEQNKVLERTKTDARNQLTTLGVNLANVGGNLLNGGTAPAENLLGFTANQRNTAFNQGADTAAAVYDIFNKIYGGFKTPTGNTGTGSTGKPPQTAQNFFGGGSGIGAG